MSRPVVTPDYNSFFPPGCLGPTGQVHGTPMVYYTGPMHGTPKIATRTDPDEALIVQAANECGYNAVHIAEAGIRRYLEIKRGETT